ncbi:MAG: transcriptional repressor [Acidimicrobiia bacterium]|nr:transcriptional repressor [Acidimicrobiia bacterium]MBT8214869.1 transcriptional repressor [Acidimicrobiia bacterium]NNF68999.1 transcriptional repressor [Acidimicrobiia bacterium]NNK90844.1 transcriptional repressor [Acidimicrobiia bacterium]
MTTSIDREVESRLAEQDVRYTRGRRMVVAGLSSAGGPLSAAELHAGVGNELPLSSLYRSLAVLEEAGVLAPHHGTKGLTRYELAEWLRGHHHHLICTQCGAVEDVAVTDRHESQVERVVDEISSAASFTPVSHALEIEGRCARCT